MAKSFRFRHFQNRFFIFIKISRLKIFSALILNTDVFAIQRLAICNYYNISYTRKIILNSVKWSWSSDGNRTIYKKKIESRSSKANLSTVPGYPPRAGAGRCGRSRRVVARAGEVRVLRRLPGDQPGRGPPLRVQQPKGDAAVMVVLPRVRTGGTEVFTRRHRGSSLVLLLLDLGYLVGVLVWPEKI